MSKITSFLRLWGPALLLMAIIFVFSSTPSSEVPNFGPLDLIVKKGGHAIGYGLLALTYLHGLKGDHQEMYSRWLYLAWMLAVLFSATDEFHQSLVPGRHPSVADMLIDSLGAAAALMLANQYYKQKRPAPVD